MLLLIKIFLEDNYICKSDFVFVSASQAKRTLKAQKLQDELASGKLDPTVSVQ